MLATTSNITPFEEQVLQVIKLEAVNVGTYIFFAEGIARRGKKAYGTLWGGSPLAPCKHLSYIPTYPTINRFLGSLAKKGLVERKVSHVTGSDHRSYAKWRVTEVGCELLGLPPAG